MDDARVVDIWFSDANSFGSGYLLSDRLVLTAGHVAKPQIDGSPCVVRRARMVKQELAGTLRWVHPNPAIDAALIDLAPSSAVAGLGTTPRFGRIRPGGGVVDYACRARGFPRASRNKAGERDDKPFAGKARTILRAGRYEIIPEGGEPIDGQGWSGFSGASLFCGDLLFGIIASVPLDYAGRVLHAVPVADLFADPGFLAAVVPAGASADGLIGPVRHDRFYHDLGRSLRGLSFYIDRKDQLDIVTEALAPAVAQRPPLANSFVVAGVAKDAPHLLIQRIASDERLKPLFGDAPVEQLIVPIEWPDATVIADVPRAFAALRASAAQALCLPPEAADDAALFRAHLAERRRAAGMWWSLVPNRMGAGHAELMELWEAFCAQAQPGRPPLLTFICLLDEEPRKRSFSFIKPRADERPDPRVLELIERALDENRLRSLDELREVVRGDLDPWLKLLAKLNHIEIEDEPELRRLVEDQLGDGDEEDRLLPFGHRVADNLLRLQ